MSSTKESNPFHPLKATKHMLTRQILIGQQFLTPFGTVGTKLSSGVGGIRIYLDLP